MYLSHMKMAFQQYKPSPEQHFLGMCGLLYLTGCIILVLLDFVFGIYINPGLLGIAAYGSFPALVGACIYLPAKVLVINLKRQTLHYERRFLFISIPMPKKPLPQIEYISAFYQLVSDGDEMEGPNYSYTYDVNAWYGNRHLKLCSQYTADAALRTAHKIAFALKCDLLDATNPEHKVWMELPWNKSEES